MMNFIVMVIGTGAILGSVIMLAQTGGESDPAAIFWFFVAACGFGAVMLAIRSDNAQVGYVHQGQASYGAVRPAPAPKKQRHWVVFHGTPSYSNAESVLREGFIVGLPGDFGAGIYTTFDFALASKYARDQGCVFRLYINRNTPFLDYDSIPGRSAEEKRLYCLNNNVGLVFVKKRQFFISYGYSGYRSSIPGLERVELLDKNGHPVSIQ